MTVQTDSQPSSIAPILDLDLGELRLAIQAEYQIVAEEPDHGFHFHTGRPLARILGYEDRWMEGIPEATIASFAGTGNPFSLGALKPGERVVDVGCGAGIDSLIAAKMVGADGWVVGVDMTPGMIGRARRSAAEANFTNVEFCQGFAEELPANDGWADVVISNGVLNLMPDKAATLQEVNRVLKPGGRLQLADILVDRAVPDSAKNKIDLWTGWIAGALLEAELEMAVVMAGFVDFEIAWRDDVFDGAPQEGSAASFGTVGINFRARKPEDAMEWHAALAALSCEMPVQPSSILGADSFYDAGDKGCAEGPIQEIAARMREMNDGQTLEVRATDPTVRIDLPAWTRMVGHELVKQQDDHYLLRRG